MIVSFRHFLRLPLLILALCLLSGPAGSASYAWCLDVNGQSRFVGDDDCCPGTEAGSGQTSAPSAWCDQGGCGDSRCLDVSSHLYWRSPSSRTFSAKIVLAPAAATAAAANFPPADFREWPGNLTPFSAPRISESILLHRTIVLLV